MTDTSADAPSPGTFTPRSTLLPVVAAWLVPGLGHLVLRRVWPGIFVAVSIWTLFAAGCALSGFENVAWDRHQWLFALQALAGLPTAAAAYLTRGLVLTEIYPHHTVGDLYTCVAGLLNLVAIGDVHARCTAGDPEDRLARKQAEERLLAGVDDTPGADDDADDPESPGGGPPPLPAAATGGAGPGDAERRDV